MKKITAICVALVLLLASGCQQGGQQQPAETDRKTADTQGVVLHILENDTAKSVGYLQELLDAFNAAYADQGISAVDANMDEFTDLAENGPYGYGPDVLYQANDKLMTYAEDKHILPLTIEDFDCYSCTPQAAWDAFAMTVDGQTYYCGIPVNIQEPMLFYREDRLPEGWETDWDKNQNGTPDFFENWNDLYAYSKLLRDTDESAGKDSQYGFMASLNNLYLSSQFMLSHGGYIFGLKDGVPDTQDIGFSKGNSVNGLSALRQFAALMNEGCIDDTITLNRYEKLADGSYFCAVSTPDTQSLFLDRLTEAYAKDGLSEEEAKEKAQENLKMIELPGRMPADGDLSKDSAQMSEDDWVQTIVMGGVNGYGISSYTQHREECIEFVNFATSYEMIKTRMQMLGIAPTRSDVAQESSGVAAQIFDSLAQGRIYLMPSVKAVDQIWVPVSTIMADVAKDPFREQTGETPRYSDRQSLQEALETVDKNIYDAIHTLSQ